MNLFDDQKPFLKGNLHCHTTRSDGVLSPREVKTVYRGLGYDFLAMTDHRILSEAAHTDEGMLLLPGLEMDFMLAGEALHLVGIGMRPEYEGYASRLQGPQGCIDAIRRCGGRAILAHPAWSLNTTATLCALRDVTAAEIYNSVSTYPWNGDRADSSVLLDIAAAHGALYNVVASDDAHRYQGEAGRGFTMVQADELSQEGILSALDEGRFYCSQGPRFEQISLDGGYLSIRCSPVTTILFYSNLVWANGRCLTGEGMTYGRYDLSANRGETFLRVQIMDAEGKSAWSNPISLK